MYWSWVQFYRERRGDLNDRKFEHQQTMDEKAFQDQKLFWDRRLNMEQTHLKSTSTTSNILLLNFK